MHFTTYQKIPIYQTELNPACLSYSKDKKNKLREITQQLTEITCTYTIK